MFVAGDRGVTRGGFCEIKHGRVPTRRPNHDLLRVHAQPRSRLRQLKPAVVLHRPLYQHRAVVATPAMGHKKHKSHKSSSRRSMSSWPLPVMMVSVAAPQRRQKKKKRKTEKKAKKNKDKRKEEKEPERDEDGEQEEEEEEEEQDREIRKTGKKAKKNEDKQRKERTELDRGEEDGEQGREQEQEERKELDQELELEERKSPSASSGTRRRSSSASSSARRQSSSSNYRKPSSSNSVAEEGEATAPAGATSSQLPDADVNVLRGQAEEEEVIAFVATAALRVTSDHPLAQHYPCSNAGLVFAASVEIRAFLRLDLESGGTAARDWAPLLAAAFPECAGETLEHMLMFLVRRCHAHRQSGEPGTECIEFWAGLANLTLEHVRQGMTCRRFDKAYSATHDCLRPHGLRLWLDELCRSAPECLVWNGTQCSSFVGLCRHQSKRRASNNYLGDESRRFVQQGVAQMRVVSFILFLSCVLGNKVVLEQPSSSCLPSIEPLRSVLKCPQSTRTTTWLGRFGGDTPKPLQLWHTRPAYAALRCTRPPGCFGRLTVKKGCRYSGKSKALKASQAYPAAFAREVARITVASRTTQGPPPR